MLNCRSKHSALPGLDGSIPCSSFLRAQWFGPFVDAFTVERNCLHLALDLIVLRQIIGLAPGPECFLRYALRCIAQPSSLHLACSHLTAHWHRAVLLVTTF